MALKACQNYLVRRNIETLKFRTAMGSSVNRKFALELIEKSDCGTLKNSTRP